MIKIIVSFTNDHEYLALANQLYPSFQIIDSDIPSIKSPYRRKWMKLEPRFYPGSSEAQVKPGEAELIT